MSDVNKSKIVDSEKRKPAVLGVETLKTCAGENAVNPYLVEVSELFNCFHGSGTKKRVLGF